MIEISQETFRRIMEQKMLLDCLRVVGVEQWPGFEVARRMYEDMDAARPTVQQCQIAQARLMEAQR